MKRSVKLQKKFDSLIKITSATVRVPFSTAHSESLNIETEKPFEVDQIKNLIADSPGIVLEDEPEKTIILSHLMP